MDQAAQPRWQYDTCPRWLKFSGLPQALNGADWDTYREIVMVDHQTAGMASRRYGRDKAIFALKHEDIMSATGLSEASVWRAIRYLAGTKLLSHYKHGAGRAEHIGGRWSHFGVNTRTLRALYGYVGPQLRRIQGGIWGLTRRDLPPEGNRIYGAGEGRRIHVTWEELSSVQAFSDAEVHGAIDLDRVAQICGL